MGANKTYQQKGDRGRLLGESSEFKRLRRAVEKAHGDRDSAIAFVAGSITCPRSRRYPLRFEPLHSRCSEHRRIDANQAPGVSHLVYAEHFQPVGVFLGFVSYQVGCFNHPLWLVPLGEIDDPRALGAEHV